MDSAEERVLLRKASGGDIRAFEALVAAYEKVLYNLAFRLTGNKEDAMDVVQDVFLKAYQALPRFRGDSKFSTWLYRVCVNASMDVLRMRKKGASLSLDGVPAGESLLRRSDDSGVSTEVHVETRVLAQSAMAALSRLDPAQRAVIVLCDMQGHSYQEISEILGISVGTVKSRLHRARQALREAWFLEQLSSTSVQQDERGDL